MGGDAFSTHLRNTNHLPSSRLFPGFMRYACPGGVLAGVGRSALIVAKAEVPPIFCSSTLAEVRMPLASAGLHALVGDALQRARTLSSSAVHLDAAVRLTRLGEMERLHLARDTIGRPLALRRTRGAASAATRIAGHRCMVGFDDASRHGPRDQHRAIREPCSSGPSRWPRPP